MPGAEHVDVEIRWSDVDAYGHVSHIALVAIAEHGRSRWLDAILEVSPATWPYIVARLELDYRAPITFDDRFTRCHFEPTRIGSSSVQLRETFSGPDGTLVMEAQSVIVAWDEAAAGKRALTEREVELLRAKMATE